MPFGEAPHNAVSQRRELEANQRPIAERYSCLPVRASEGLQHGLRIVGGSRLRDNENLGQFVSHFHAEGDLIEIVERKARRLFEPIAKPCNGTRRSLQKRL